MLFIYDMLCIFMNLSYRLLHHCNVFQAEVTVILKAAQCLLSGRIFSQNLQIYLDSQAVIKFLINLVSTSVFVHECSGFL